MNERESEDVVASAFDNSSRRGNSPVLNSYWRDIRHCDPVSREEEVILVRQAREGDDDALARLVSANLRFVVSVAKEFRGTGQPLSELISDGNVGLLEAARRFDERRGFKFITYAVWWIRQSIRRALAERRRTVSAPSNRLADLKDIERSTLRLSQKLGRSPSLFEICDDVGYSTQRVLRAKEVSSPDVHLDRSLYADEEDTTVSSLFETNEPPPETQAEEHEFVDTIDRCLEILDVREREIIRRYYGFDGCLPMTLEQIGRTLSLTRERIRQLRDRGLAKLRNEYGDVLVELSHN
ncbi:MAG: RNA polymerase sigma factor RpoD/SigA [Gemmatimonadetes bacterium]|nr:RNA polymerase sigma factor RpoD/SigA [Gemmatimonadota bacterium]MBT7860322.1 RNA polymerase sigma factor RpoD/SigA [Gemmatimonadota bacterium]